jgi:hypothetical protein
MSLSSLQASSSRIIQVEQIEPYSAIDLNTTDSNILISCSSNPGGCTIPCGTRCSSCVTISMLCFSRRYRKTLKRALPGPLALIRWTTYRKTCKRVCGPSNSVWTG